MLHYTCKQALFCLKNEYIRLEYEMRKLNNYISYNKRIVEKNLIYFTNDKNLHLQVIPKDYDKFKNKLDSNIPSIYLNFILFLNIFKNQHFIDVDLMNELETQKMYNGRLLYEIIDIKKLTEQIRNITSNEFYNQLLKKRIVLNDDYCIKISGNYLGVFGCYITSNRGLDNVNIYYYPLCNKIRISSTNSLFNIDKFYQIMNSLIDVQYLPSYYMSLLDKYEDKKIMLSDDILFDNDTSKPFNLSLNIQQTEKNLCLKRDDSNKK